jgi:hypothetical protein
MIAPGVGIAYLFSSNFPQLWKTAPAEHVLCLRHLVKLENLYIFRMTLSLSSCWSFDCNFQVSLPLHLPNIAYEVLAALYAPSLNPVIQWSLSIVPFLVRLRTK